MAPVSLIFLSVPVRSWANTGPASTLAAAMVDSTNFRRMRVLQCELTFVRAGHSAFPGAPERPSVPDLNTAPLARPRGAPNSGLCEIPGDDRARSLIDGGFGELSFDATRRVERDLLSRNRSNPAPSHSFPARPRSA